MNDFYEKQLVKGFEGQKSFTREELYDFYRHYEPELKSGTLGWRIYDLKQKDIIKSVGRGIYALSRKPEYTPKLNEPLKKIARILTKNFSDLKYCLWESAWLNEFSGHQTSTGFILLETEKELINSVFFNLRDNNVKNIFLQPDQNEIEIYVLEKENPIILKHLISRAPLQKIIDKGQRIFVPRLEKILTDLYCDRDIFYFYSGKELQRIFEKAINHYTLDFSRLFTYANRRGRESELKEYMRKNFEYLTHDYIK